MKLIDCVPEKKPEEIVWAPPINLKNVVKNLWSSVEQFEYEDLDNEVINSVYQK